MSNPIRLFLKFRHYVVILFLKLFFTVIDQQTCKLECGLKNYGQMQKTTDNVLFDYTDWGEQVCNLIKKCT